MLSLDTIIAIGAILGITTVIIQISVEVSGTISTVAVIEVTTITEGVT